MINPEGAPVSVLDGVTYDHSAWWAIVDQLAENSPQATTLARPEHELVEKRQQLLGNLLENPGQTVAEQMSFLRNECFKERLVENPEPNGGSTECFTVSHTGNIVTDLYEIVYDSTRRIEREYATFKSDVIGEAGTPVTIEVNPKLEVRIFAQAYNKGTHYPVEITNKNERRLILEEFLLKSIRLAKAANNSENKKRDSENRAAKDRLRAHRSREYRQIGRIVVFAS